MAEGDNQKQDGTKNPLERLRQLLQFDPSKKTRLTAGVFAEVVGKIKKERLDATLLKAEELLRKAISLQETKAKADADYDKLSKTFDKELGGVLGNIQQMLDGVEVQKDVEGAGAPASE